jgi:ubiquinone/menaquinone biosynthesis C-methylase UbiE
MDVEKQVAAYYTRGTLEDKILSALRLSGKGLERLRPDDLAGVDQFHVGERESVQDLAEFMDLWPGMHLLDVGCGIGGPARYFASRGCRVTGIDLTEEFLGVAEVLTRMVKLDRDVEFRRASALQLPFDSKTFDGAYEIHAGMNFADKPAIFREVARVLKPGARFAIFDAMRTGEAPLEYPMPWASGPATDFVASLKDYRRALQDAGFHVDHQRGRRQFAVEFVQKMAARAQASSGPPPLSIHLLMGERAPLMLKNVMSAIASGTLDPIELVATLERRVQQRLRMAAGPQGSSLSLRLNLWATRQD